MVKIRTARGGDLKCILDLYEHLHAHDQPSSHDTADEAFRRIVNSDSLHIFLLEDNGVVRASCYLNVIDNLTRGSQPYGVIENVVCHADHRRRGFAKAVVEHALAEAWADGCYKVMLLTGQDYLVRFYEACGFESGAKSALIARAPKAKGRSG